jgi:hypothetical protein
MKVYASIYFIITIACYQCGYAKDDLVNNSVQLSLIYPQNHSTIESPTCSTIPLILRW